MSKKKTSVFDLPIYIFAIGGAAIVMGSAFWILIIGGIVFVIWMVIRALIDKDEE